MTHRVAELSINQTQTHDLVKKLKVQRLKYNGSNKFLSENS